MPECGPNLGSFVPYSPRSHVASMCSRSCQSASPSRSLSAGICRVLQVLASSWRTPTCCLRPNALSFMSRVVSAHFVRCNRRPAGARGSARRAATVVFFSTGSIMDLNQLESDAETLVALAQRVKEAVEVHLDGEQWHRDSIDCSIDRIDDIGDRLGVAAGVMATCRNLIKGFADGSDSDC